MEHTIITSTQHKVDFLNLSPEQFEEICYWILSEQRDSKLLNAEQIEYYGGSGDKGRDIVVFEKDGQETYYNCKRYKKNNFPVLRDEINKLVKYRDENNKKISKIVFCTAENVSPHAKDKTRKYAKDNNFNKVFFLGKTELDKEVKGSQLVGKNFFRVEQNTVQAKISNEDAKNISEEVAKIISEKFAIEKRIDDAEVNNKNYSFHFLGLESITGELEVIKNEIDSGEYEDTEKKLHKYIGQLELDFENKKEELFKANNLLGIIYLRRREAQNKSDLDKAVKHFQTAIELNPESYKGYNNLFLTFIALNRHADIDDNILEKFKNEPYIIHLKAIKISIEKKPGSAMKYLDAAILENKDLEKDKNIKMLYARLLLEGQLYDKCIDYCNAIKTENEAEFYYLVGSSYLMKAIRDDRVGEEQFTFIFKETENIIKAIEYFEEGLRVVKSFDAGTRKGLELNLFQAKSFIGEQHIKLPEVISEELPEYHNVKAIHYFKERKYQEAYEEFIKIKKIEEADSANVINLAEKFIYEGQVEIAEDILKNMSVDDRDVDSEKKKYLHLSLIAVLKKDKNAALINAKKAKELAGKNMLDVACYNFNGVSIRFGEVDRMVRNVFEMQHQNPQEKILESFDIEKEDGMQKVIKIFEQHKKRMDSIVSVFREQPLPYYLLTKKEILNKRYIEFWEGNYGIIPIKFNVGNDVRTANDRKLLKKAKAVVLDYISLLTLSEFEGGFEIVLDRFENIYVPKTLFYYIQEELVHFENENLRKVWEFLRTNSKIQLIRDTSEYKFSQVELFNYFDEWVRELAIIANTKNAILLTDDLRFGNFFANEKILFTNTSTLMQNAVENGEIDRSVYVEGMARIANRGYEFIQFKSEDIYELELKYSDNINPALEKMFSQIGLDEAVVDSFFGVAIGFIRRIEKWQIPDERKVEYLKFFTRMFEKSYFKHYQLKKLKNLAKNIFEFWMLTQDALKINKNQWIMAVEDTFSYEYLLKYKKKLLEQK
jgi:hypothetical protein